MGVVGVVAVMMLGLVGGLFVLVRLSRNCRAWARRGERRAWGRDQGAAWERDLWVSKLASGPICA